MEQLCDHPYEVLDEWYLNIKRGDQVIYVPSHLGAQIYHPDNETGFITSLAPREDVVFVRYWRRGEEGKALRNAGNSEATPIMRLWPIVEFDNRWVDPKVIDGYLTKIAEQELFEA